MPAEISDALALSGARRGARRLAVAAAAVVLAVPALLVATPQEAVAFGTVNTLGQNAEHERITRAALACAPGKPSDGSCFEPNSISQLSGKSGTFGAVGSPDSDEMFTEAAHCDNADFVNLANYPRTRVDASAVLRACVAHLQTRFTEGVAAAAGTVTAAGAVVAAEVVLDKDCTFTGGFKGRDKCEAIEGLGRALHGVQDFYSHSNWTDRHDAAKPLGPANPPGLDRSGPIPLFDFRAPQPPPASAIPQDLTTGCFSLAFGCSGRVNHSDINKDKGLIDPHTGHASQPGTPRGKLSGNFERAVQAAVLDTRRQWADFRTALTDRYGADRGARIACTITRDNPVRDCAAV